MHKYRSLFAWQQAHQAAVLTLTKCDSCYHPRSRALFDQLRRATISVEANIVEGYALSTPLQFRRHLRIAMGSAAEAECLTRLAAEVNYLPVETTDELQGLLERAMAALHGLIRKISVRT
jgi:four helix bundle protein